MVLSMVNGGGGSAATGGEEGTDGSGKRAGGDLDEAVGVEGSTAVGGAEGPDGYDAPCSSAPCSSAPWFGRIGWRWRHSLWWRD
jgi:hypothetical protein